MIRYRAGCLVYSPYDDVYYVPRHGGGLTFSLEWEWFGDVRDAVVKSIESGEPPHDITNVEDALELQRVIEVLADPEGVQQDFDEMVKAALKRAERINRGLEKGDRAKIT